ncbi:hypothetical protein H0274_12405 [Altererythrobacter sp. CC-YST694]|uniref:hypothetical protein n=1 Tax=Altererythrobacter sp. CC-YST694 TaxID=2755038 RepID=UPI001D0141A6|nr:hypothetical protein [Altererythrobacter sp. CC-YST694]MCB5426063.1 hypothetical protein [Altererythrobacter sp. CC-YST694]
MNRLIRWASLGFATFSTVFWAIVDIIDQIVGQGLGGAAQSWLTTTLPAILFGMICVLFCHWFARRILRQFTLDTLS